mmetsp:Transcript_8441/g.26307  ORF Transcript_8441/g.26307 Transcript_8441/m.26307 type:complete len:172 (+) Transcript_8441:50-565(+)
MSPRRWIAVVAVAVCACPAASFAPPILTAARRTEMGMLAPEVTKTKTRQRTELKKEAPMKQKVKKVVAAKPQAKVKHEVQEEPKFRVFLLGDESYEQEHVCKALMELVEGMDIKRAEEIYETAKQSGQALIIVVAEEKAEFIVEQLVRKEPMIFAELEPEGGSGRQDVPDE